MHTFRATSTLFLVCLLFASCEKEEHDCPILDDNGLTGDINDVLPSAILDSIIARGMPIYGGNTPPDLQGSYLASRLILESSNRENDEIGKQYLDLELTIEEQNDDDLSATIRTTQSNAEGEGLAAFIVGTGNNFTLVAEIETVNEEDGAKSTTVEVYSGRISEAGIVDFSIALFLTDDFGDPSNTLIEIGDGRIFIDEDGLAQRTE